jgi:hypothetical protein
MRHYELQGFHCHRNKAVPLQSLPHSTSKSLTSGWFHSSTIAQTRKVSHQHITRVWCCTGPPAVNGQWRPQCFSTKLRWGSPSSSTLTGYFWDSETVHGGNHIHKDWLANHFQSEVQDGWRNLDSNHWSPGSTVGISQCSWRYSLCVNRPGCPSLKIDTQTPEAVSVYSVLCSSIGLMMILNLPN